MEAVQFRCRRGTCTNKLFSQCILEKSKARFKRRTLHVPNLIRFGTCKVRRMNQLGTALLHLGRACRIERQKIDVDSFDS